MCIETMCDVFLFSPTKPIIFTATQVFYFDFGTPGDFFSSEVWTSTFPTRALVELSHSGVKTTHHGREVTVIWLCHMIAKSYTS